MALVTSLEEYNAILKLKPTQNKKDYEIIQGWLDTLYATNRIKFSLKGILLIGY